jgi:CRP-like cAMP-binding protein
MHRFSQARCTPLQKPFPLSRPLHSFVGLSDDRFLQTAREIEVSTAEFEWLATGTLPPPPPPPRTPGDCGAHTGGQSAPPRTGCTACEAGAAAASLRTAAKERRARTSSGGRGGGPPYQNTLCWPLTWCAPAAAAWAASRRRAARARAKAAATRPDRHVLFDPVKEATATCTFRGRSILGLPLVHPTSRLARVEDAAVAGLDATYSAFLVPVAVAFVGKEEWAYWSPWAILDAVVGCVFTCDILFSLHRAATVRHNFRRRLLADGRLVARAYALHSHAALDIVTVAPFWVQVGLITFKYAGDPRFINALFALRVLRLLRVMPLIAKMFDLTASDLGRSLMGVFSTAALYLATMLYVAAVLVNLLACLWFFTARLEGGLQGAKTWMSEVDVGGVLLPEAGPFNQYIASAYFAIATLTTVGYGDITAQTAPEMGVAAAIMFAGILFFGFVVNSMGATLESSSAAGRRGKALRAKFDEVEAWMHSRRLPGGLRRRILEYYSEVWVRSSEWRERDLYKELPPTLRSEVTRTLALDVFRSSDIFCAASEPLLHETASGMTPLSIFPGFDLCEQGEPADGLWVMHEGELLLLRDGVPVDVVRAPAIVGESVILADRVPEAGRRVVTMRAVTLCTLWHLPAARLGMLLDRCPQIRAAIESDFRGHIRKYAARVGGGAADHHHSGRGGGGGAGGAAANPPTAAAAATTPRSGLVDILHRLEESAARTGTAGPDAAALRRNITLARAGGGGHGQRHRRGGGGGGGVAAGAGPPLPTPPGPEPRQSRDLASLLAAEDAEELYELPPGTGPGGSRAAPPLASRRPSTAAEAGGEAALDTASTAATMGSMRPNIFARLSGRWLAGGGGGAPAAPPPTPAPAAAPSSNQPLPSPSRAGARAIAATNLRNVSESDRLASSNVLVAEFARSLPRARVRAAARASGSGGLPTTPTAAAPLVLPPRPPAGGSGALPFDDPLAWESESLAEEMVRLAAEAASAGAGTAARP